MFASTQKTPRLVGRFPLIIQGDGVSRPTARQKGHTDAVTAQSFAPIAARFLKPRGERLKLQLELDLGQDTRSRSKQTQVLSCVPGWIVRLKGGWWRERVYGFQGRSMRLPNQTITDTIQVNCSRGLCILTSPAIKKLLFHFHLFHTVIHFYVTMYVIWTWLCLWGMFVLFQVIRKLAIFRFADFTWWLRNDSNLTSGYFCGKETLHLLIAVG